MTVLADSLSRIDAKTFAEDFRRYAVRISPSVRIRSSQNYIRSLLANKTIKDTDIVSSTPPAPPTCVRRGNEAIAIAQPEPPNVTPEPEIDFLPQTDTQKRTRNPKVEKRTALTRGESGDSAAAPFYDRTLKDRIVTFVKEQGPATSADIGQHFGMERRRTSVLLADLKNKKRLFVVGYKKNEWNQVVGVLHTDLAFAYVSPNIPDAQPITEEKRPARIPSLAAVDRGRALIARNFSRDSIAMRVFEQLCLRPRSIPELQKLFRCGDSKLKFMLDRMQGLDIVEKVGQDRNEVSGKLRALFGVVEAEEVAPLPRVPPSPEIIANGRALIIARCIKHGGKTLETFDELCAHGPLTRGDLQERLNCHRTMIDVALRTLDAFGLVVDLGKTIGSETGHMRRLWDVKNETEAKA